MGHKSNWLVFVSTRPFTVERGTLEVCLWCVVIIVVVDDVLFGCGRCLMCGRAVCVCVCSVHFERPHGPIFIFSIIIPWFTQRLMFSMWLISHDDWMGLSFIACQCAQCYVFRLPSDSYYVLRHDDHLDIQNWIWWIWETIAPISGV